MRFPVHIRTVIFAVTLVCAALAAPAQVVWEKTWGGPYDDACEIRNTRDGGIILMGTYGIHSWLLRLDANGDTLWTRLITQPYDMCAVTETEDGGFLTTGVTRYNHRDLLAWKFDVHGDSLWMRIYPDSNYTEGMYSVYAQPDNSFLITGYTSANGYDMLAMQIDSVGNAIWTKAYGGVDFEGGTMAARTTDGGQILSTTVSNGSSYIWVVKVDSAGDTVWTRNLVDARPTGGSVPMVDSDGKIWIVGWMDHAGDYNNYVACLDSGGNTLWTKEYLGIGFESRSARGIIQDRFGGYTFASSVDHAYGPVAGHDIALFRIDSLGNVLRIYRLGGLADEMPRYFEQAANGDYLFCGYSASFSTSGNQTYIARLAPTGCGEYLYDIDSLHYYYICPGDSFSLDAGAGFLGYLWNDGDTNRIRPVLVSDTFYVASTDTNGCPNYSNTVIVELEPLPSFTWTQTGSLTVQFADTAANGSSLYWAFGDGDTSVVAHPIHTFPQAGMYQVCFTATYDSCSPVTVCDSVEVIDVIGVLGPVIGRLEVFPNPASQGVYLRNRGAMGASFVVQDAAGRVFVEGQVDGNGEYWLGVDGLPEGLWLVEVEFGDGVVEHYKVVVQR